MIKPEIIVYLWFLPVVLFFGIPLLALPLCLIAKNKKKILAEELEISLDSGAACEMN